MENSRQRLNSGQYLIKYAGVFSTFLGMVVVIGWHFNLPVLIQLNENFVPMQHNTALCFILCGGIFLSDFYNKAGVSKFCGAFLFLLASLTIFQYLFGYNLGIDQVFIDHYITTKTSHPGRMAPNTALCFLIISLIPVASFLKLSAYKKSQYLVILCSLGAALSAIAFLGYIFSIESAYGWHNVTKMAIHTSFGFLILNFAVVGSTLSDIKAKHRSLPVIVGALNLVVFVLVGQTIERNEFSNVKKVIANESRLFSSKVVTILNERLSAFKRISERIVFVDKDERFWRLDAQTYYRDFGFFKALKYADQDHTIRWVYPREGNESAIDFDLKTNDRQYLVIERAKKEKDLEITHTIDFVQGGRGVLFIYPLFDGEHYQGSSIGAVDIKSFFDSIYGNLKNPSFGLKVYEGERELYSSDSADINPNVKINTNLSHYDLNWELSVAPTQAYTDSLTSALGGGIVFLGVLVSILSGFITYFYQMSIYARDKAEEAKKAKSGFLASMSHEIRTPLNGVLGMASLLNDEKLSSEGKKHLKAIESSGETLRILINDILDFSKIEAGKMTLEENTFSLLDIIKQTSSLFYANAKNKGLNIDVRCEDVFPDWIKGDSTRITQVISNLLSNAIKFSEKGVIQITGKSEEIGADKLIFQVNVKDEGLGIDREAIKRLFNIFEQADNSIARKFGGTGLGLAISKKICESMGGDIWVESEVGQGATFSFTFIAKISEKEGQSSDAGVLSDIDVNFSKQKPFKILVADDNNLNQILAKKFLNKLGYEPDLVANGAEALEALKSKDYDIIYMDGQMPELDGYEASVRIRRDFSEEKQPWIIAFTASTSSDDKKRCREAGMDDFLGKPISIRTLIESLENAHGKRHLS